MFTQITCVDTIRIPPHMLGIPTLAALHSEIDAKYPNRVLMEQGLVICRYGECLKITNGSCVPGDGGAHHECLFRLVVFRPFVEEVCVGNIVKSSPEGIQVRLGNFFQDIFIPAYWMLRPSRYDETTGLWVWAPEYDDDDDEEADNEAEQDAEQDENDTSEATKAQHGDPSERAGNNGANSNGGTNGRKRARSTSTDNSKTQTDGTTEQNQDDEKSDSGSFEMELGATIRFKVKSIHFTQVTNTAKGMQATTTTTAHSRAFPTNADQQKPDESTKAPDKPLRKRSTSVDLTELSKVPASMHIVASICEDGLGLTSWWASGDDDEDEEPADAEE